MAPNYSTDESLGDALREYFAAEAPSLRAPSNLWDSLEGRLEEPRRMPRLRRKVLAAASRYWFPTLATGGAVAAGAVLAVWATTANLGEPQVVEKIVTQEVIKEVPVETVVTREVIKEVPVETVVTKEVIKEVAVEKIVARPRTEEAAMMAPPSATAAATPAPPAPAAARPPATTFQDNRRQPVVATADDAVSTFSLDTDRTSYQLALNWARQGYDIEPDSVRAEEWINAFNYQYAQPADAWGFAITSDVVAHPLDERKHLARIGFQAAEVPDDRPLNVTLVLDASGSMRDGNRVDIARAAAETIRQSLRPQDRVAVVHFTTEVIHDLTVNHRPPDDSAVWRSIRRLEPHGSTNVQAGLNLGVRLANQARLERPSAYNYVILMSDGVANVDATNPFAILESAYDRNAGNPLRLITVGVGITNYNDVLLEQLAQHGNGWYRYLDTTDQAQRTFSRANWLALSTPFADQTRAQVTWDPDVVKSWRIIGYENRVTSDASFAEDRKEFAELPSGAATTVFYEIELHDRHRGRSAQDLKLGRVELRWVVPETGQSRSQQVEVTGRSNLGFGSYEADPLLRLGGIVALAADRYSSLPRGADYGAAGVSTDLAILQEELRALAGPLGGLDAYRDFSFVLERMAERAYTQAPPRSPSGYSR
ncbi:MAG: von Willebrand factor type A domain-containing protein [Chloroflexi bacterium]|nr:von Willebrand factor type A domain-containing protein [Chloroflexota bacterium]